MIPSVLPTYNRAPLSFVKGEGTWLIEADGRRFLDLGAGIAVNVLGHAHPTLVQALTDQANALWHTSNLYQIPQQQALADKLVDNSFADTVFFCNSGTEACELAVKMARKYWSDKGEDRMTYSATDPRIEIDFVMYRPVERFEVVSIDVLDEPVVSDHRPVLAGLRLRPGQ